MFKILAATAALSLAGLGAASATPIFFDDFNAEAQGTPVASLTNWDITRDSVDVIGDTPAISFNFYPGNGNYIDLNGSTANTGQTEGRIQTKGSLGLKTNASYTVSFDYGTNANPGTLPAILTVGLGTAVQQLFINAIPATLQAGSFTFKYDGSGDYLSFADDSGTPGEQGGPVIDNVSLAPVPLPAGGLLLIGALGGLAVLRRRKA